MPSIEEESGAPDSVVSEETDMSLFEMTEYEPIRDPVTVQAAMANKPTGRYNGNRKKYKVWSKRLYD